MLETSTQASLPNKTHADHTLADGTRVRILVLNSLHRGEADRRARRHAQSECRSLLKGGTDHPAMLAQIKALTAEEQAQYIAGGKYWEIHEEAERAHPDPLEPEQGDLPPDKYTEAVQQWEQGCRDAMEKRRAFEQKRFEQEQNMAGKLTVGQRVEACLALGFLREFTQAFVQRLQIETLVRAVRLADGHRAGSSTPLGQPSRSMSITMA